MHQMKAEDYLPLWMEEGNMPTDEERIAEMRPEEWLRFANALVKKINENRDLFAELAHKNGLKEDDHRINLWRDKNGNKYKLKRTGFEFIAP